MVVLPLRNQVWAFLLLVVTSMPTCTLSFNADIKTSQRHSFHATSLNGNELDRRSVLEKSTFAALGGAFIQPAWAVVTDETPIVTTRMGGLLEKYQDSRGWKILAPSGWNKFEGEVGAYDVKWQDVVDNKENVKVSSTPVKSTTTSVSVLGEVQPVGESLAAKRNAKLIKAEDRITEGILFYSFEFALPDATHQLLLLCVNKGKIWSLDANSTEKRWGKREELYYNIIGSFMPKLS